GGRGWTPDSPPHEGWNRATRHYRVSSCRYSDMARDLPGGAGYWNRFSGPPGLSDPGRSEFRGERWESHAKVFERGDDPLGDIQVPEPLSVGRHHVPRRPLRAGLGDCFLVGFHVNGPSQPLLEVGLPELPVLAGVVEPFLQPSPLFSSADVQEKLEDGRPLLSEHPLEIVNLPVPSLPDGFRDEAVDPGDEDVLVVTSIEKDHLAPCREVGMDPPKEVVVELFHRGRLERHHAYALRIDPFEHAPDRSVLSGGVDPLKHH